MDFTGFFESFQTFFAAFAVDELIMTLISTFLAVLFGG